MTLHDPPRPGPAQRLGRGVGLGGVAGEGGVLGYLPHFMIPRHQRPEASADYVLLNSRVQTTVSMSGISPPQSAPHPPHHHLTITPQHTPSHPHHHPLSKTHPTQFHPTPIPFHCIPPRPTPSHPPHPTPPLNPNTLNLQKPQALKKTLNPNTPHPPPPPSPINHRRPFTAPFVGTCLSPTQ